jgi:DNA-directed RNA polymerase subunit RPC12/RpoP
MSNHYDYLFGKYPDCQPAQTFQKMCEETKDNFYEALRSYRPRSSSEIIEERVFKGRPMWLAYRVCSTCNKSFATITDTESDLPVDLQRTMLDCMVMEFYPSHIGAVLLTIHQDGGPQVIHIAKTICDCGNERQLQYAFRRLNNAVTRHKPMRTLLVCPKCNYRHMDLGEWATRPHHTHECQECKFKWRVEPYCVGV